MASSPASTQAPDRNDSDYPQRVLSYGRASVNLTSLSNPQTAAQALLDAKKAMYDEWQTCQELVGAWTDNGPVLQECQPLLDSAEDMIGKAASADDIREVQGQLFKVRISLAKAGHSEQGAPPPCLNDRDYPQRVLTYGSANVDYSRLEDPQTTLAALPDAKQAVDGELKSCRRLVGAWSDSKAVTDDCDPLLAEATQKISGANSGDDIREAQARLHKVRERLVKAGYSKQSKRVVKWLLGYNVASLLVCFYLLSSLLDLPVPKTPSVNFPDVNLFVLGAAIVAGAIGGGFDALRALHTYYGKREFDRGNWPWYLVNPLLGAVLGAAVFGVILTGLLTTTGTGIPGAPTGTDQATPTATPTVLAAAAAPTATVAPAGTATAEQPAAAVAGTPEAGASDADTEGRPSTNSAAFILVLAFLAGFKQNLLTTRLERIAMAIFGGDQPAGKAGA